MDELQKQNAALSRALEAERARTRDAVEQGSVGCGASCGRTCPPSSEQRLQVQRRQHQEAEARHATMCDRLIADKDELRPAPREAPCAMLRVVFHAVNNAKSIFGNSRLRSDYSRRRSLQLQVSRQLAMFADCRTRRLPRKELEETTRVVACARTESSRKGCLLCNTPLILMHACQQWQADREREIREATAKALQPELERLIQVAPSNGAGIKNSL